MQPNPFLGVAVHGVGAFSASSCYTPQKQTKLWAWEVYWVTTATFAWLVLPVVFAFVTIDNYGQLLADCINGRLKDCPPSVMWKSFSLGVLYGFGGLTFGLGIRYIGFSLNYAIAIGISAGLGTIVPLIWNPNDGLKWKLAETFSDKPGMIILAGIVASLVGIVFCGWAGALREQGSSGGPARYSFRRGVPYAVMAGMLSAVYKFALDAGDPLSEVAAGEAGSKLLSMNAIYPFSNSGAWLTNVVCCGVLIARNKTGSQFQRMPGQNGAEVAGGSLSFYYLMALLSGTMWYFQFFFYGIGQAYIGPQFEYTSWALHMSMLILFSNVYGILFREWRGAGQKSIGILTAGMAIIVLSTLVIAYGQSQ